MLFSPAEWLAVGLAFGATVVLTPLVRALARRWGMVACPRADRWHKKPTALLGGVAIFAAVLGVYLLGLRHTPQSQVVMGASAFLWLVGLVDDVRHLKPYQKLIGQVMGTALVIYSGLQLPWTASPALNVAITIFWLVGITNAVNLLDNMDGLAAGVAAIAAVFLGIHFLRNGQTADAQLLAVFAAALLGFLVYNTNPASIFMGDCGSMFLGFFLAGAALLPDMGGRSRSFLPVLAVPVLVLFIPIFDITLVTVMRKLAGRATSQGGRDHTSHRLVALGMSERRAVGMLYGLAVLSGIVALLVRDVELHVSLPLILGFSLVLTLLGVYLGGVKVYAEAEIRAAQQKPLVAFLVDLSYKRRVFEVLLDVGLIILAYHITYTLLFGSLAEGEAHRGFIPAVTVLVFVKIAALLAMGVYRGIWRYVGIDNLIGYAKAVALGEAASALALLCLLPASPMPPSLFVLDGLLLLVMLAGSRLAFRLFRNVLPKHAASQSRRVLIYGAGDAGELALREILNNQALHWVPVGFLDDDPLKKGKVIHGLPVLGGNGDLGKICVQQQVAEVLLTSVKIPEERINEILHDCRQTKVVLKRFRIVIEDLAGARGTRHQGGLGSPGLLTPLDP